MSGRHGEQEQTCALRALNVCDGQSAQDWDARWPCHCVSEELCNEVGWSGAAESHAVRRRAHLARAVMHPSWSIPR